MPKRIADTGGPTVTLMADDGNIIEVVRDVADRIVPEDIGMSVPPGAPPMAEVPESPAPPALPIAASQQTREVPLPDAVSKTGISPLWPGAPSEYWIRRVPGPTESPGEIDLRSPERVQAPQAQQLPAQPQQAREPGPQDWLGVQGFGLQQQAEGIQAQGAAQQAGLQEQAEAVGDARAERERIAQERQKLRMQEDAQLEQQRGTLEEMLEQRRAAKVDPGRFWANKDSGQKVLAGIGVALAGLGMAMKGRGGENPALDILMKAVDDDVRAQQINIAKMGEDIAMQRGLITDFQKQFQTNEGRYQAAIAEKLNEAKAIMEEIGLRTQSEEVAAITQQRVGELAVVRSEALNNALKAEQAEQRWAAEFRERVRHAKAQEGIGYGGLALRRQELAAKIALAEQEARKKALEEIQHGPMGALIDPTMTDKQGRPIIIGISRFGARDKKQAVLDQEAVDAYVDYHRKLVNYEAKLRKAGGQYRGPKAHSRWLASQELQELEADALDLAWSYTRAMQGARPAKEDVEQAYKMFGAGAKSLFQRWTPESLAANMRKKADDKAVEFLTGRGISKARTDEFISHTAARLKATKAPPTRETSAERHYKRAVSKSPGGVIAQKQAIVPLLNSAMGGDVESWRKLKEAAKRLDDVGITARKAVSHLYHSGRYWLSPEDKFLYEVEKYKLKGAKY